MKTATFTLLFIFLLCIADTTLAQSYREMMDQPDKYSFKQIVDAFNKAWEDEAALKTEESGEDEEELEGEYFQFKRWEEFMKVRLDERGYLFNYSEKNNEEIERIQQDILREEMAEANWTGLGPSNYDLQGGWIPGMGRINCIAFHPTDPDIIWIGTAAGGLWKTTNHGFTWTALTDKYNPSIGVSGIAVNPLNPNQVYILTGDGDGGLVPSIGVLVSNDNGITWLATAFKFSSKNQVRGYKLIMKPGDPQTMLVATNQGVYVTHNGFATKPKQKLSGEWVYDLEFHPSDPDFVYLASAGSFFRSKKAGDTWKNITTSSNNTDGLPDKNLDVRIALAVSSKLPDRVFAAYATADTGYAGIFMSDDRGLSFTQQTADIDINVMGILPDGSLNISQPRWDFSLISPDYDADLVMIGGVNLWKSLNRGNIWEPLTHWNHADLEDLPYVHSDHHALEINPLNNLLYSANDGGIYYSTDTGKTWIDLSAGLAITQIYRMSALDPASSSLYFGAQDNGINMLDDGSTVMKHLRGADGSAVGFNDAFVFAAINYGKLQRNTRENLAGGSGWEVITPPSTSSIKEESNLIFYPFAVDPNTEGTIWAGYDTLYKSTDNGNNWSVVPGSAHQGLLISRLAVSNSTKQMIYAVNADNTIDKFDGVTSNVADPAIPDFYELITDICLSADSAKSNNYIWVSYGGYVSGKKIYRSNDGGITYNNYSQGLPNVPVHCLAYVPGDSTHLMFAGTEIGVYYRDTTMTGWLPYMSTDMPKAIISDIKIDTATNTLYAATFGRGIWKSNFGCNSQLTKAVITGESSMCEGESLILTADGPCGYDNYLWSNGETTKSIEISSAGVYSVTLSNGSGTKTATHKICTYNESEPFCLIWQESLGINLIVTWGSDQCEDGSTILAGQGSATLEEIYESRPGLTKIDLGGNVLWSKLFNSDQGVFLSVDQTDEGGFIAAGLTRGITGGVPGYHYSGTENNLTTDIWVLKTDDVGNIEWERAYGGSGYEFAKSIHHTSDGGYIVLGVTNSPDGDVAGWHQFYDPDGYATSDLWILKLDHSGNILWQKCLGGTGSDGAYYPWSLPDCDITQTFDGGYVIVGFSGSVDGDVSTEILSSAWVVKVDADGDIVWQSSVGGPGLFTPSIQAVLETAAHDIILAGSAGTPFGLYNDIIVAKFNSSGQKIFETILESPLEVAARDLVETNGGGILVVGNSTYSPLYVTGNHGGVDYWVVHLNDMGVMEWNKYYGGSGNDDPKTVTKSADGSIILGGFSTSTDGDITEFDPAFGFPYGWVINLGTGCPAPIKDFSATSITSNSAEVHWGTRACVNGYQVNYRMTGEEAWTVIEPEIAANQVIFDLLPSTEYQWRVRSTCQAQSQSSFSEYSPIQQFTTLSVKTNNNQVSNFNYHLYPNPTNSGFTIELQSSSEGVGHLEIHSLVGNLVYAINLSVSTGQNIIDIGPVLPGQGMYFVTMRLNDNKLVRKIMKL